MKFLLCCIPSFDVKISGMNNNDDKFLNMCSIQNNINTTSISIAINTHEKKIESRNNQYINYMLAI